MNDAALGATKASRSESGPNISFTACEKESSSISIPRSDGMCQDIANVLAVPALTNIIAEEMEKSEHADNMRRTLHQRELEDKCIDRGTITFHRSDGMKHDLVDVMKFSKSVENDRRAAGEAVNVRASQSARDSIELPPRSISVPTKCVSDRISLTEHISGSLSASTDDARSWNQRSSSINSPSVSSAGANPEFGSMQARVHFPASVRIVHMSDTFNHLKVNVKNTFLPEGDILIHSGNFTLNGTNEDFAQFDAWLGSVSGRYHYRVVCPGKRDVKLLGNNWGSIKSKLPNATHVLCHTEAIVLGIRIYGCAWQVGHSADYSLKPDAPGNTSGRFNEIPEGVHVLVTHGPASGRLDHVGVGKKENWGSTELLDALRRVKPGLHLHGHLHQTRGVLESSGRNSTLTINSHMCDSSRGVMYGCPHVIKALQVSPGHRGGHGCGMSSSTNNGSQDSPEKNNNKISVRKSISNVTSAVTSAMGSALFAVTSGVLPAAGGGSPGAGIAADGGSEHGTSGTSCSGSIGVGTGAGNGFSNGAGNPAMQKKRAASIGTHGPYAEWKFMVSTLV